MLGFSLLFGAAAAIGRVCFGTETALQASSRYMVYLIPGFLGFYFHALTLEGKLRKRTLTILLLLSIFASFPSGVARKGQMGTTRRNWKACYILLEDIAECDSQTGFMVYPDPSATGLQEKLLFLKEHRLNLYAP